MATKFLELSDGVIIEIGAPQDMREEMSTASRDFVSTSMDNVGAMLAKIVEPLGKTFRGLYDTLDVPIAVESAEVELGLSFSAEGNLFVAKSKTEGTLKITVKFKSTASGTTLSHSDGALNRNEDT